MNPMFAAIKKRKAGGEAVMGDHQDSSHQAEHADDKATDMHAFVANLSEKEKGHLKAALDSDKGSNAQAISKGGASTTEKGKIQEAIAKEDHENALEDAEEGSEMNEPHPGSDDIAKSMIDSRFKGGSENMKPRNLNDRMQMGIAAKLKAKGKL